MNPVVLAVTVALACGAGAAGGWVGLRSGRKGRQAVRDADTSGEEQRIRLHRLRRIQMSLLASAAVVSYAIVQSGLPRWLIVVDVLYSVFGAAFLEVGVRRGWQAWGR